MMGLACEKASGIGVLGTTHESFLLSYAWLWVVKVTPGIRQNLN